MQLEFKNKLLLEFLEEMLIQAHKIIKKVLILALITHLMHELRVNLLHDIVAAFEIHPKSQKFLRFGRPNYIPVRSHHRKNEILSLASYFLLLLQQSKVSRGDRIFKNGLHSNKSISNLLFELLHYPYAYA